MECDILDTSQVHLDTSQVYLDTSQVYLGQAQADLGAVKVLRLPSAQRLSRLPRSALNCQEIP